MGSTWQLWDTRYENLPPATTDGPLPVQLDIWCGKVFKSCKCLTLSLVVKACLSIFTGPHMKAFLRHMNDIIDKKSNCMCNETYSGIMNINYSLQTKTSSELYKISDPLHDPVNKNMCYFFRASHARFKKRTEKKLIRQKEDLSKGMKVYSKKQCVNINWRFCDLFDFPNVFFEVNLLEIKLIVFIITQRLDWGRFFFKAKSKKTGIKIFGKYITELWL